MVKMLTMSFLTIFSKSLCLLALSFYFLDKNIEYLFVKNVWIGFTRELLTQEKTQHKILNNNEIS